ncbi:hypothetical protein [Paenibacillus hexagrammi]|uniref:Uncharacterized protein n=1 Tax=Paenibacillus hexagrammi TaxID=2908839 RepID=A0ABY3SL36_9BACL|nr:hypothetical protein [Paenibacillus sp. YPD9-1]UJF34676.1 hypothetical protein L0M14_05740 [Paenibacillus sp. YPD9-1]
MNQGKVNSNLHGHLFTVEILIEEATNGLALEQLLHLLNSQPNLIKDYKVLQGIQLGKLIEANTAGTQSSSRATAAKETEKFKAPEISKEPEKPKTPQPASENIIQQLEQFKANNTLIRLTIIKGKGIKLSLPCRILNYDGATQNVTVYHVDEKKVYLFKLNEIDDYVVTK